MVSVCLWLTTMISWALVRTRITVYHEKELRQKAKTNWKLSYLNVSLTGLGGRPHPSVSNILTTRDAMKLRSHIKLLAGDFLSYELLAVERGGSPKCRLCPASTESTQHILSECRGTADTRERLLPELLNLIASIEPNCSLLKPETTPEILTQFILDPTSMNLPNEFRISTLHPHLSELFSFSRDWCHSIVSQRSRLLKNPQH